MRPRADDGVRARVDAAVRKFHAELRRLALHRAHALVRVDGDDHIVGHEARLADHFFRAGHVGLVYAGTDARFVCARDAHGSKLRRAVGQLGEITLRAFQLAVSVEVQRGRDLAQLRELRLCKPQLAQLLRRGAESVHGLLFLLLGQLVDLRDERALTGHGQDIAVRLQLAVGPLDGVGVDGELSRQLAHGRQPAPRRQHAGQHETAQLRLDLLIDRARVPVVDGDHGRSS